MRQRCKKGVSVMKMKKFLQVMTGVLTALALSGCGAVGENASESGTEASDGTVTISFSWWGGDSRHEATEKAIAAFEKKYPNIKVNAEYGAWNGWEQKQSLNLSGGNGADVMQINWA